LDNFRILFVNNIKQKNMNITINVIELASELAAEDLYLHWHDTLKLYDESDETETKYTDEAQDIFNELYDKYLSIINDCKL
jgi:hypothetical protein